MSNASVGCPSYLLFLECMSYLQGIYCTWKKWMDIYCVSWLWICGMNVRCWSGLQMILMISDLVILCRILHFSVYMREVQVSRDAKRNSDI